MEKENYWPNYKTNTVTFHSVLSTFLIWGNILPAVFISQLMLCHTRLLTIRLLEQGYVAASLKSSLQKFYGCHHELVDHYRCINLHHVIMNTWIITGVSINTMSSWTRGSLPVYPSTSCHHEHLDHYQCIHLHHVIMNSWIITGVSIYTMSSWTLGSLPVYPSTPG